MKNNYRRRSYKGKKILITGSTGFIGWALTKALLKRGCRIYAGFKSYKEKKIRAKKIEPNEKLFWRHLDITNPKETRAEIARIKPDYIFHLAAEKNSSYDLNLMDKILTTNFLGTFNILVALKNIKFKKLVLVGTSEEYGQAPAPFKESQQPVPISPYGFSKKAATDIGLLFHRLYGYPVVVLRPTVVYGPGQEEKMFIPSLVKSIKKNKPFALRKGKQERDFVYLDDVVEALLKSGLNKRAEGEIINIGSGKSHALKQVIKYARELSKFSSKVSYDSSPDLFEMVKYSVEISKARSILGWKPTHYLKRGLKKTLFSKSDSK